MSDEPEMVACVIEHNGFFESWCLECGRILAIGPDFDAMADWTATHRKLIHGDDVAAARQDDAHEH